MLVLGVMSDFEFGRGKLENWGGIQKQHPVHCHGFLNGAACAEGSGAAGSPEHRRNLKVLQRNFKENFKFL